MAWNNPANTALRSHRFLVLVENPTAWRGDYSHQVARLQDFAFDWTLPMQTDYEIGNIDPVGSSYEPVEPAATLGLNMVSTRLEALLAGKPFSSLGQAASIGDSVIALSSASDASGFSEDQKIVIGRASSYESATIDSISSASLVLTGPLTKDHLAGDIVTVHALTGADFITQTGIRVIQLIANQNAGTPPSSVYAERIMTGAALASLRYNYTINAGISQAVALEGTDIYDETVPTRSWGAFNTVDPGSIKGKDAIICIGGSDPAVNAAYRLQSFGLTIAFPVVKVKELGNRVIAGVLVDVPQVTVDFDLLEADLQPDSLLGNTSGSKYQWQTLAANDIYIRVYDGRVTRAALGVAQTTAPVRSFKVDNVVFANGGVRNSVRGFGTKRFTGTVETADTSATGGIAIYAGDIT